MRIRSLLAGALGVPALVAGVLVGAGWWVTRGDLGPDVVVTCLADAGLPGLDERAPAPSWGCGCPAPASLAGEPPSAAGASPDLRAAAAAWHWRWAGRAGPWTAWPGPAAAPAWGAGWPGSR